MVVERGRVRQVGHRGAAIAHGEEDQRQARGRRRRRIGVAVTDIERRPPPRAFRTARSGAGSGLRTASVSPPTTDAKVPPRSK